MRALITGVAGFAGRHLVALARSEGAAVFGVGRRSEADVDALGLDEYRSVDLTDDDATRRAVRDLAPERVFHLAAAASVAASWRDPAESLAINAVGALSLLEAVRQEAPDASVLLVVSSEEYGTPRRLPLTEDHPLAPSNPYGVGKATADMLGQMYAAAHGMHVVRARAFNHTGPGQPDSYITSRLARRIAAAEAARASEVELAGGNLAARRDFSDVRDVVRAYWDALELAAPGVYNVCSGRAVEIADIVRGLASLTHLRVRQLTDPALVRDDQVGEIVGSHQRLTSATGWEPRIPLERTLRDTLDWWRSRGGVAPSR